MFKIKMQCVVLDCPDAQVLADFYSALLGWTKRDYNPEWTGVSIPGELPYLLFQQVEAYEPPVWPDAPDRQRQMTHVDFMVNNLEEAERHALACGAVRSPDQFSEHWTVMFDPAGHPFCLVYKDF